jgi:hypothetical protein
MFVVSVHPRERHGCVDSRFKSKKWLIPSVRLIATRAGDVEVMDTAGGRVVAGVLKHDIGCITKTLPYAEFCDALRSLVNDPYVLEHNALWVRANDAHEPMWFWLNGQRYQPHTKRVDFMGDVMLHIGHSAVVEREHGSHLITALAEGCLVAGMTVFPKMIDLINRSISADNARQAQFIVADPARVEELTGRRFGLNERVNTDEFTKDERTALYAEMTAVLGYDIPEGYDIKDVDMRKAHLNWATNVPARYITRKNAVPGLFAESFAPTPAEVDEMLDVRTARCEGYAWVSKVDFGTASYTPEFINDIVSQFEVLPDDVPSFVDGLSEAGHLPKLFEHTYSITLVALFRDFGGVLAGGHVELDDVVREPHHLDRERHAARAPQPQVYERDDGGRHEALARGGKPCYVIGPGMMLMSMNGDDIYLVPGGVDDAEQLCALANQDKDEHAARVRTLHGFGGMDMGGMDAETIAKLSHRQVLVNTIGCTHVEFRTPKASGLRTFAHVAGYVTRGVDVQLFIAEAAVPWGMLLQSQLDGFHRLWTRDADESTMPIMRGMRIKKDKKVDEDGNVVAELDRKPNISSLNVCPMSHLVPHGTDTSDLPDVMMTPKHPRAPFMSGFGGGDVMLLGMAGAGKSYAVSDAIKKRQLFNVLVTAPPHDLCNEHASGPKQSPAAMTHAMLAEDQGYMDSGPPRDELLVQYGAHKGRCVIKKPYSNIFVDEANFLSERQKQVVKDRNPRARFIFAADLHPVTLAPRQLQGGKYGKAMNDDGVSHVHVFEEVHRTDQPELKALWADMYAKQDACETIAATLRAVFKFFLEPQNDLDWHIVSETELRECYNPSTDHIVAPTRNCCVCGQSHAEDCVCAQGMGRDEINFADREKRAEFDLRYPKGVLTRDPHMSQVHTWADRVRNLAPQLKVRDVKRAAKIIEEFNELGNESPAPELVRGGRYIPRTPQEATSLIDAKACHNAAGTSVHAKQGMTIEPHERMFMIVDKTWDVAQLLVQVTRVKCKESLFIVLDDGVHADMQQLLLLLPGGWGGARLCARSHHLHAPLPFLCP